MKTGCITNISIVHLCCGIKTSFYFFSSTKSPCQSPKPVPTHAIHIRHVHIKPPPIFLKIKNPLPYEFKKEAIYEIPFI